MARVLVVDDQKLPRVEVAASLGEAGHEVRAAESGQEGLRMARGWCPDVIVLDVFMPGMDGFEVVAQLKDDPLTEPIPVIFLTPEPPTDQMIVRGLDLGAHDFLTRNCSRAELLARVGVMARIKRGRDELSALARISDSLIQTLDPAEMGRRFARQVCDIFRGGAALLHVAQGNGHAAYVACDGLDEGDAHYDPLVSRLLERLDGAGDGNPVVVDLEGLVDSEAELPRRKGLTRAVAVRTHGDDRPPVTLAVFTQRKTGLARSTDAPLLRLLARQAGIALDNALLHQKLEHAMTERSRFFATMSHELRTPITAVIGYNQLLELGSFGELTASQARAVSRVGRSAQHLLELINDVLDISKLEAGKLQVVPAPVDLRMLVRDTATSVQLQAEQKGLALQTELPYVPTLLTDAARVRQILLNLLSNAVKFTAEGSVRVRLQAVERELRLAVEDTGPGIDPADAERIFEEFEQAGGGTQAGGTGLGLAISRRLAALLGGRLELQSTPGKGTVFTLALPLDGPDRGT